LPGSLLSTGRPYTLWRTDGVDLGFQTNGVVEITLLDAAWERHRIGFSARFTHGQHFSTAALWGKWTLTRTLRR
jgi:hypothetical protein